MSLAVAALAGELGGTLVGDGTPLVSDVRHDSRAVVRGDAFVAIPGRTADGAKYVADAIGRGASVVIAEHDVGAPVPTIVVSDARAALASAAHAVHGDPTRAIRVIGITGTNGKTTVAWLVESILSRVGADPALLGTVGARVPGGASLDAAHTTPEADDLVRFIVEARRRSASHLVMEVSSHALALHRVDHVRFAAAAFTNLTQDHLDFHGDMAAYGAAKAALFRRHAPAVAVMNFDDPFVAALAEELGPGVLGCSTRGHVRARLSATDVSTTRDGIVATLRFEDEVAVLASPLVGPHNVENALLAVGCARAVGVPFRDAVAALREARGAPGRLERVSRPREPAVFVDYAHTPDALDRALAALRSADVTPGRLIVVFGCGGDRDRDKRAPMGRVAAKRADLAIVTSDNPRSEDPASITAAVARGLEEDGSLPRLSLDGLRTRVRGYVVEVDRARAISFAIEGAAVDDTVLIAGKGHERVQIVGDDKRPFDDREVARRLLDARAAAGGERRSGG